MSYRKYSVVIMEDFQELFRGCYSECLRFLRQSDYFEEFKSHAVIIIRSEDLDNIKNLKLG